MARVRNVPVGASVGVAGSATAPAASAAIATIAAASLPAGTYRVYVKTGFAGTAGTLNDFEVRKGSTDVVTPLLALALANTTQDRVLDSVELDGSQALTLNAIAGHGATNGVYVGELVATRIA